MTITTTDFPESLQKLLIEIQQTNTSLTVTHEGQPIVIISPAQAPKARPAFGFMKGEILGDIVSPVEQSWDVLQ